MRWTTAFVILTTIALDVITASATELNQPTPQQINILYASMSGKPIDFLSMARQNPAYMRASEFDRESILKQEEERLKKEFASFSTVDTVKVNVGGSFSEYSQSEGGFPLDLFQPGVYIPYSGGSGIKIEDQDDFRVLKMDVPDAKALLSKLSNYRSVTYAVRLRPFAVDLSGERFVRAQVLDVQIFSSSTKAQIAEIKTSKPLRPRSGPGEVEANAVPIEKLNAMGLSIGSKFSDFLNWSSANNFLNGSGGAIFDKSYYEKAKTMDFGTKGYMNIFFAPDKKAFDRYRSFGSYSLGTEAPPPALPGFQVLGENFDCNSEDQTKQICGRVSFGPADTLESRPVIAFDIAQNISSGDVEGIKDKVVAKYGNYIDKFDVTIRGMRAEHLVWGAPFEINSGNTFVNVLGAQRKHWAIEVLIVKLSSNRTVLVTQFNGYSQKQSDKPGVVTGPRL